MIRKLLNKIEFYFVKPKSELNILFEIIEARKNIEAGTDLKKFEKRFGKTKVLYTDNEVRVFSPISWLQLGHDIVKVKGIKIKRCGRN
jgi:hypothetical protein